MLEEAWNRDDFKHTKKATRFFHLSVKSIVSMPTTLHPLWKEGRRERNASLTQRHEFVCYNFSCVFLPLLPPTHTNLEEENFSSPPRDYRRAHSKGILFKASEKCFLMSLCCHRHLWNRKKRHIYRRRQNSAWWRIRKIAAVGEMCDNLRKKFSCIMTNTDKTDPNTIKIHRWTANETSCEIELSTLTIFLLISLSWFSEALGNSCWNS